MLAVLRGGGRDREAAIVGSVPAVRVRRPAQSVRNRKGHVGRHGGRR